MENKSQIIIYKTENGKIKLDVRLENETVWLTQKQMADLFQTTPQNITIHLKNIYEEGELIESATCKDFLQVRIEGERTVERNQKFYNLDAIISVGYRESRILPLPCPVPPDVPVGTSGGANQTRPMMGFILIQAQIMN